jgi:hypothetical protein
VLVRGAEVLVSRLPRIALAGFVVALVAVHAIAAWWQPLQVDDWGHLLWDVRHDGGWLATHFTSADMVGYALAHSAALTAIVSALAYLALVIGAFVLANRRLPRSDAWDDVLAVIAVSALLWIAQPRAGLVWFHRTHVALHLWGCAVAVWLLAPFRCGWRVRRGGMVALAVAGLIVGTSSRQIALATLVGVGLAIRRTPRPGREPWMWVALAGLAAGTVIGLIDAPHMEPLRVLHRGLEPNLNALNLPIREGGQLIALVVLLALARLGLDRLPGRPDAAAVALLGRPDAAAVALPEPRETYALFWAWLAICVVCLFGPRYSEATLLPSTVVLVIAALPYVAWLCGARVLRWAVIAFAIGVHVIAWATALTLFGKLGGEFRDRMTRLETAPPGSVAVIAPYSEVQPSSWFFGEDLMAVSRQLIGIELFGVRDIELAPRFHRLEDNPHLEITLESDGLSDEQVRAASPAFWATDAGSARQQLDVFTKQVERAAGKAFTARLVVGQLEFPERKGRPLYAGWYEHGEITLPRVVRATPDPTDRQTISLSPFFAAAHPEAYAVRDGKAVPLPYDETGYKVQPMVGGLLAVIACNARRCLLVDALLPHF